jgi:hypothetical protein
MIPFTCRQCGKGYRISDSHAGKRVRCKPCGTINKIPESKAKKVGSGDSVAALNKLLAALSDEEKKAPYFELDE